MSQSKQSKPTAEERRQSFLRAAISLFFEQGVESTTMQQVASAAGVSYGLFYHYFRSKEDLLGAAAEQLSMLPMIKEFLGAHQHPLEPRLYEFVPFYLELMEQHRAIVWLIFTESRKRPALAARIERLGLESRAALMGYLKARRKAGEIREDCDLDATSRMLLGQLFLYHVWEDREFSPQNILPVLLRGITSHG
ncbi:MAG: helix-turn-helix domain-containing protein [Vulcanimicrobiota bacterium]